MIWPALFSSVLTLALCFFGIWLESRGFVIYVVLVGVPVTIACLVYASESEDD